MVLVATPTTRGNSFEVRVLWLFITRKIRRRGRQRPGILPGRSWCVSEKGATECELTLAAPGKHHKSLDHSMVHHVCVCVCVRVHTEKVKISMKMYFPSSSTLGWRLLGNAHTRAMLPCLVLQPNSGTPSVPGRIYGFMSRALPNGKPFLGAAASKRR